MADTNIPDNTVNNSIADYIESMSLDTEGTLKSIDLTLKAIARQDGLLISQSSLKDLAEQEKRLERNESRNGRGSTRGNTGPDAYNRRRGNDNSRFGSSAGSSFKRGFDGAVDDFEREFKRALFGSSNPLADAIKGSVNEFAKQMGVSVDQLGGELGKVLGQSLRNSKLGERLAKEWQSMGKFAADTLSKAASKYGSKFGERRASASDMWNSRPTGTGGATRQGPSAASRASEAVGDIIDIDEAGNVIDVISSQLPDAAQNAISAITNMGSSAAGAAGETSLLGSLLPSVTSEAGALGPVLGEAGVAAGGVAAAFPVATVAILAASVVIDALSEAVAPAIEGFKSFASAASNASNKVQSEQKRNLELWKKRIEQDTRSMVEQAYSVITQSAERAMEVWDNVLQTVSATQGYEKAGVQSLYAGYAKRLKDEGLASVISSADIMENLKTVLEKGLYGQAAEEFAFMATYLNQAIPTQDFFQYADTYASIAANLTKNGMTQEDALKQANKELEAFASNLLYASREIASGFSTDMSNGAALFADAAKIALTSRDAKGNALGDVSDISAVLTSVSAIVSATAPDLASSLVDAVTNAALGGNSSAVTALRSMAGVGASNTAFLQALAKDPQKVFATMFGNLAKLQNMSAANYMEVAEGLSEVFGMSIDAFARVDFGYLADAISQMDKNNGALSQNLQLLMSGETTSTADQLRMQKINEYMINEGLAYVLDNEVAREVQKHMWEEQMMREIQENTFAVELTGGALDFLQGIAQTVENIINFLNPFSWIKKIGNLALTAAEAAAQSADMARVIQATRVGNETATNKAYFQLLMPASYEDMTGNLKAMGVYRNYANLLGIGSAETFAENVGQAFNTITGQGLANQLITGVPTIVGKTAINGLTSRSGNIASIGSKYRTRMAGKGEWSSNAISFDPEDKYNANWTPKETAMKLLNTGIFKDTGKSYGANATAEEREADAKARGSAIASVLASNMDEYLKKDRTKTKLETALATKDSATKYKYSSGDSQLEVALHDYIAENTKTAGQGYMTQKEILDKVMDMSDTIGEDAASFEDWADQAMGMKNGEGVEYLTEALTNYNSDINTLRAKFDEAQAKSASKQTKARELHEVQFWEDMQRFATELFPEYLNEWKKYYILHTAYTDATADAYKEAMQASEEKKLKEGDAILTLADKLTSNELWSGMFKEIADPTVQSNMLLAKILLTVQSILQQTNETSIVSVPTALSSLGLGLTTPGTPNSGGNT